MSIGSEIGAGIPPQNAETSPLVGAQGTRFGSRKPSGWAGFKADISGVESAPSSELALLNRPDKAAVQWLVVVPGTVTAYDVTVGRWVKCTDPAKGITIDQFVPEATISVSTAGQAELIDQEIHGDPVGCYISAYTGSGDIDIIYRYTDVRITP